jgi:dienelactone hydrolase
MIKRFFLVLIASTFLSTLFTIGVFAEAELFAKKVGSGATLYFVKKGTEAKFESDHTEVSIWTPKNVKKPPVMIYSHGGGGYGDSDKLRVSTFRQNGFATISFDAFIMNGQHDLKWVNRNVTNIGKQMMLISVAKGAYEYALTRKDWDTKNIFLYGHSNGARVALMLPSDVSDPSHIRGVLAEGMPTIGLPYKDAIVPTRLYYGKKDTWGGRHDEDFMWSRVWRIAKVSVEDWVSEQDEDVKMVFYANAGHSFHYGDMKPISRNKGGKSTTAFLGAGEGVLDKYTEDMFAFIQSRMVK